MIKETQRTGFYIQITNFQLDQLENISNAIYNMYQRGFSVDILAPYFTELAELIKEMQKGNT
jgi:hypothetical protein